jgi:SAM-dependent methyltransferase
MAGTDPLEAAFGHASPEHFAWQTQGAVISDRERALVQAAFLPLGQRVLDLGCGEGATLFHLGAPAGACGIDLFEDKVRFASTALPQCRFVRASVYELPFEAGSFDHVIVRDVVHHLDEPARFVDECARVLQPGGRIDVLEPCRNNPLIALHGLLLRAERGELRSTPAFISRMLARRFDVTGTAAHQALPLHRIVYHPDLGRPELTAVSAVARLVNALEAAAEALLPRAAWAYFSVRAVVR